MYHVGCPWDIASSLCYKCADFWLAWKRTFIWYCIIYAETCLVPVKARICMPDPHFRNIIHSPQLSTMSMHSCFELDLISCVCVDFTVAVHRGIMRCSEYVYHFLHKVTIVNTDYAKMMIVHLFGCPISTIMQQSVWWSTACSKLVDLNLCWHFSKLSYLAFLHDVHDVRSQL